MKRSAIVSLLALVFSSNALASGYSKPTWGGARPIGLGGAFVGVADDPTAIWHNASGLSFVEGKEHLLYLAVETTSTTDLEYTPAGGPVEEGKKSFYPVPTLGYVNKSFKNLSLGLGGVFTYASGGKFKALSSQPALNPGEGTLYSFESLVSAAYKLTDFMSLSAALRVVRTSMNVKDITTVLATTPLTLDSANELSVSGWAVGGAFGTTIKPADWLQLGAHYRTKIKTTLSGSADLAAAGNTDLDIHLTLPANFTTGFSAQINPKWMIAFQYDYEFNDQNKEIGVSNPTLGTLPPIAQNFRNTHTYHFGAEFAPTEKFSILGGYAKDFNEAIPDPVVNRVFTDVQANEYSLGFEYQLTKSLRGAFTYHAREGRRIVPAGPGVLLPSDTDAWVSTYVLGVNYTL